MLSPRSQSHTGTTEEIKMETKKQIKQYRYFKNVTVNFEWIVLAEIVYDEQDKEQSHCSEGWLAVSKIIEIEAELFEPSVLDQLDELDKIEQRHRRIAMEKPEDDLNTIKNRRAELLSITDQSGEAF